MGKLKNLNLGFRRSGTLGIVPSSNVTAGGGEELETDADIGSTADKACNRKHALWPAEGQDTSMHSEEPQ